MSHFSQPLPTVLNPTPVRPAIAPKSQKFVTSPYVSFAAGTIAGGVEAAITYPFEFAKTRVQLQNEGGSRNPLSVVRQVIRAEGIAGIYKGCTPLVAGNSLKAGVRFLSYDTIKNALADPVSGKLSAGSGILAGMVAGTVEAVVAVAPTERIKTALIDDAKGPKRFRGAVHVVTTLFQQDGIAGLYRGLPATVMKQASTSAVRMGTYNVLKETSKTLQLPQNPATVFGMGAVAGTITVYATQPLDTIKTRAQSAKGASTVDALMSVLRENGVKGLWGGSTMRLGRLVLSGGIVFSVYEQIVRMFPNKTPAHHNK